MQFLFSFWSFNLVVLKYHSTQTALMAADDGMWSVLVLLDLSAAFDTIDYGILWERLRHWVGIFGTALQWFSSYLSNRKFCFSVINNFSWFSSVQVWCASGVDFGTNLIFFIHAFPWAYYSWTLCLFPLLCWCYAHRPCNTGCMTSFVMSKTGCEDTFLVIVSQHMEKHTQPSASTTVEHIKPVAKNLGI